MGCLKRYTWISDDFWFEHVWENWTSLISFDFLFGALEHVCLWWQILGHSAKRTGYALQCLNINGKTHQTQTPHHQGLQSEGRQHKQWQPDTTLLFSWLVTSIFVTRTTTIQPKERKNTSNSMDWFTGQSTGHSSVCQQIFRFPFPIVIIRFWEQRKSMEIRKKFNYPSSWELQLQVQSH